MSVGVEPVPSEPEAKARSFAAAMKPRKIGSYVRCKPLAPEEHDRVATHLLFLFACSALLISLVRRSSRETSLLLPTPRLVAGSAEATA